MSRRTRSLLTLSGLTGAIIDVPEAAGAHGVGGRQDLPLPLEYFVVGAGLAIVISFVWLGLMWRQPRLQDGPQNRSLGWQWPAKLGPAVAAAGVVGLALVLASGVVGNGRIAPYLVWILFWLVVPFLSALVGNLYSALNPWRTLGELLGLPARTVSSPYGLWPATVALLAFVWLELVALTGGEGRTLGLAALLYTAWLIAWMIRFGVTDGLQTADVFTSYNRLLSAISPIGRDFDGHLVWRGWLRALPVLPQWKGLTAFVVVMIGTVTYDGLSSAPAWSRWFGDLVFNQGFDTVTLVAVPALIGGGYWVASWAAVRLGGVERSVSDVAASFAHTLVPIGLAYAFAHYFTLILFEGQALLSAASDPFGLGWNLFGTADWAINYTWFPTTAVWWVQLVAIVGGHILGVVLAHDRALAEFPKATAVRTQWAMLTLMVALTSLGLFILAEG